MGTLRQHELLPAESSGRQHGRDDSGNPGHHGPRRLSGRWSLRQTWGGGDGGCGGWSRSAPGAGGDLNLRDTSDRPGVPGGLHRRHADRLLAGNGGHVPAWTAARAGRERPSRSGHVALQHVAEVGGRRLGNRSACVLRPWCGARPGHHRCEPANSDCGRAVDRNQRRLGRLGCPTLDPRAGPIHGRIGRQQAVPNANTDGP
jgi:hypothetical protein